MQRKFKKTIGFLKKQDVEAARVDYSILLVVVSELCFDHKYRFAHTFARPLAHCEALCL